MDEYIIYGQVLDNVSHGINLSYTGNLRPLLQSSSKDNAAWERYGGFTGGQIYALDNELYSTQAGYVPRTQTAIVNSYGDFNDWLRNNSNNTVRKSASSGYKLPNSSGIIYKINNQYYASAILSEFVPSTQSNRYYQVNLIRESGNKWLNTTITYNIEGQTYTNIFFNALNLFKIKNNLYALVQRQIGGTTYLVKYNFTNSIWESVSTAPFNLLYGGGQIYIYNRLSSKTTRWTTDEKLYCCFADSGGLNGYCWTWDEETNTWADIRPIYLVKKDGTQTNFQYLSLGGFKLGDTQYLVEDLLKGSTEGFYKFNAESGKWEYAGKWTLPQSQMPAIEERHNNSGYWTYQNHLYYSYEQDIFDIVIDNSTTGYHYVYDHHVSIELQLL